MSKRKANRILAKTTKTVMGRRSLARGMARRKAGRMARTTLEHTMATIVGRRSLARGILATRSERKNLAYRILARKMAKRQMARRQKELLAKDHRPNKILPRSMAEFMDRRMDTDILAKRKTRIMARNTLSRTMEQG